MKKNISFFDRLRSRRSVLERTRPRDGLPRTAFYVEWLSGSAQRRVLDTEGKEHLLDDKIVQSFYKLAGGGKAKKLIAKHWAKEQAAPQQPFVAPKQEPKPEKARRPKPKKQKPEKKAEPKAEKKPAAKKKPAKKAAKKSAAKKKPAKKTAKKKAAKKKTAKKKKKKK